MTDALLRKIDGGVLTITLNRPEAANAIRPEDRDALIELFARPTPTPISGRWSCVRTASTSAPARMW